ncbi:MAG TPA: acetate/propionate family kinase [Rhodopseudomonas sp.]|uniref:acetate/propionate family kinase n=1 Tax=Rhodopseudomonas sp. TaxID=1078 RepID=UPI002ED90836
MTGRVLLTFNPGSSTIKLGLFVSEVEGLRRLGGGIIDLRQKPLVLRIVEAGRATEIPLKAAVTEDMHELIEETLDWLMHHFTRKEVAAVGHRVVHGGDQFAGPVKITDATLAAIAALVPLAPLHQPQSVQLIGAIHHLRRGLPQFASFDTAFHRTQSDVVRRFALPRELFDRGIKRYGFHGLSYKFIASQLKRKLPQLAGGRFVVAHLGSGASLCALDNGVSRDSSMGFSTLDGIPMATRCGAIDPGVLIHLVKQEGWSNERLEETLYHKSGLLGVSGISADTRLLLQNDAPEAREALELFAFRIARETLALANSMGGLDGFVFTAGIGEHQPPIRAAISQRLGWLGAAIDPAANAANAERIDAPGSKLALVVIPTDEEQTIAEETWSVLTAKAHVQ